MDDRQKDTRCDDEQLARVVFTLKEGSWRKPALADRIMEEVHAEAVSPSSSKKCWWLSDLFAWLFTPRNVRVRPIAVVAAAFLVVTLAAGTVRNLLFTSRDNTQASLNGFGTVSEQHAVQFMLVAPEAEQVMLVGSFNDWDPTATPLVRDASGDFWVAELRLSRGRHLYAFVVDGNDWVLDESAPVAPADEFGTPNSVLLVPVRKL